MGLTKSYEEQYLDFGKRLVNEGYPVYNKRTGKTRITLPFVSFEYDASEDKFPLLTVKQTFAVSAVAEILGYLRGYNNASQFESIGTKTWRANTDFSPKWVKSPFRKGKGDMGLAYRFREYYTTQEIYPSKEVFDKSIDCTGKIGKVNEVLVVKKEGEVGEVFENNGSPFQIIGYSESSTSKSIKYDVQFLGSGYIKKGVQRSNIYHSTVKDPYKLTKSGGALGEPNIHDPMYRALYRTWESILLRLKEDPCYSDVKICDRWLVFSNFQEDFKSIDGWQLKTIFPDQYSLDKDWCGSKVYSPWTTRWVSRYAQTRNTGKIKTYAVMSEQGEVLSIEKSIASIVNNYPLSKNSINRVKDELEKGGTVKPKKTEPYWLKLCDGDFTCVEVDQFKEVYAKLLTSGDDHRLLMTAWQPHSGIMSCLLPCMHSHQFSVIGDKLYLTSMQRSVDYPLGQPFNAVQCVFLLKAVALMVGLKPASVFHVMSNVHIYEDQLETFKDLLKRVPLEDTHKVKLNEELFTFDSICNSDTHAREYFNLIDYKNKGVVNFPFSP